MKFDFQKYFRDYGAAFDQPELLASYYGDCAIASTPSIAGCLDGKAGILRAMEATAAHQEKNGLLSMEPLLVETTELDPLHHLVKVQWKMVFHGSKEASLSATYILREYPHKVVILLYLAQHDEENPRNPPSLT